MVSKQGGWHLREIQANSRESRTGPVSNQVFEERETCTIEVYNLSLTTTLIFILLSSSAVLGQCLTTSINVFDLLFTNEEEQKAVVVRWQLGLS